MKKYVRAISLLILCALCLPLLSSCHGAVERVAFVMPEAFDESKKFEISFWAKNDTNVTQVNIYKKAIEDFQSYYPNVTVNLKLYTDYGRLYNDVITNIATDTTPNVCITYPDHIATYKTGQDSVVPLDALMNDPEYGLGGEKIPFDSPKKEEIIPKYLEEGYLDGAYYALPFQRSTEICYVNRTFVEKLGFELPETLTWDFIWKVSEAATKKDENGLFRVNGQKVLLPFIYKSTDNMMITQLKQLGAGYSNYKGEIELFNDTTLSLLEQVAESTKKGAFSTFKISGYPANFLNAGQCIFAIDSSAGATWMGSSAPLLDIAEENLVKFETEVMAVPQFDPENPTMISQGPSVCVFNKADRQEVLASWLFTQFLLTNEVQISYAQTEGYVPVTSKAQESPEYKDYLAREGEDGELYYDVKLRATKLLLENTENTFVTPVFNGSASLRDAAGHLIESVTKSTRRKERVDEAYYQKLFSDTQTLYRLEGLQGSAGKASLGPLPKETWILMGALAAVWLCLGLSTLRRKK